MHDSLAFGLVPGLVSRRDHSAVATFFTRTDTAARRRDLVGAGLVARHLLRIETLRRGGLGDTRHAAGRARAGRVQAYEHVGPIGAVSVAGPARHRAQAPAALSPLLWLVLVEGDGHRH